MLSILVQKDMLYLQFAEGSGRTAAVHIYAHYLQDVIVLFNEHFVI